QQNANGTVTTFDYSTTRGWVTRIRTVAGNDVLQNLVYDRSPRGFIVSTTGSPVPSEDRRYGYDEIGRLTCASPGATGCTGDTSDGGAPASGGFKYSYDPLGNLLSINDVVYAYPTAGAARPHAV